MRYEAVLKIMQFDNHTEKWSIRFNSDENMALNKESETSETTSVISNQVHRL